MASEGRKESKAAGKRKRDDGKKDAKRDVILKIWREIVNPATSAVEEFEEDFTKYGLPGYREFMKRITSCMWESVNKGELGPQERKKFIENAEKPEGFIFCVAANLRQNVWVYLRDKLTAAEFEEYFGIPGIRDAKLELLDRWSAQFNMAKTESNNKYANKVVQLGDLTIQGHSKGTRPSRAIPKVRSVYFLLPEQIRTIRQLGHGMQGEVYSCNILDCPPVSPHTMLVVKKFTEVPKEKELALQARRKSATQEMMMGGLNHKGIVGAMAMTIEKQPRLVYDHYNGGDLARFIKKCETLANSKTGKGFGTLFSDKFKSEKKLLCDHRLGIGLAILETVRYFHHNKRLHNDLHARNILLHFDYVEEVANRVYVGVCDFGKSLHQDEALKDTNKIFSVAEDLVAAFRIKYPQLAPELCGPDPSSYSAQTDIYAVGNLFRSLFKGPWDGECNASRSCGRGWMPQIHQENMREMIAEMMHSDPAKRMTCAHWITVILHRLGGSELHPKNGRYLRD